MKKILLPRLDSLGDVILLQGFLREVQAARPDLSFTLLVREPVRQLEPLCDPGIGWLSTKLNPYSQKASVALGAELEAIVRAGNWDEIWFTATSRTWADIFLSWRFADIRQIHLGRPPEPGPRLRRVLGGLAGDFVPDGRIVPAQTGQHELRNLEALLAFLLNTPHPPALQPSLAVPNPAQGVADAWLAGQGLEPARFVVCVPAGSENVSIKCWPTGNFARVVAWLEREKNLPVLLAGHTAEKVRITTVKQEADQLGASPRVWLGSGGDLDVLAGLLARSLFYFGNDTGPMHLAAAIGVPVGVVFGGAAWPRFLPAGKAAIAVRLMPCFGCDWDCCFGDAPCVQQLPVGLIQQMLADLIVRIRDSSDEDARVYEASRHEPSAEILIARASHQYRELQKVRSSQLEELESVLEESETDRAARLAVIQEQGLRIARMDEEITLLNQLLRERESSR